MEQQTEYIRTFSELEGLQAAHQLTYRIRPQNEGWRFELEKSTKTEREQEAFVLRCPKKAAYELIRFLYENAVPLESWQDILEDAITRVL